MISLLIRMLVWMNNFSYSILSSLVVRENGGLHPKHAIMKYHRFFTENIDSDSIVLDIGCGNGSVAFDIAEKAKKVVGIDFSRKNIEKAKSAFSRDNLNYLVGDATVFSFEENFDIAVLSNVLEHIERRQEFLRKIRVLAPKLLIRVPLITRDWLAVYKKEKGFEYRLDPTHFVEYTEEQFKEELSAAGLEIENYYVKFGELYAIVRSKR